VRDTLADHELGADLAAIERDLKLRRAGELESARRRSIDVIDDRRPARPIRAARRGDRAVVHAIRVRPCGRRWRGRQLHEKEFTLQRDDASHRVGELARRAACYEEHGTEPQLPPEWPSEIESSATTWLRSSAQVRSTKLKSTACNTGAAASLPGWPRHDQLSVVRGQRGS
jgi:hypothetical protein